MKTFLLSLVISISCISCGEKNPNYCDGGWDTRLTITNNTGQAIYVVHSAAYPDTNSSFSINNYEIARSRLGYVSSSSKDIQREGCTWDDYFNTYVTSDTLMIFIILDEGQGGEFHLDREGLSEKHNVLKRYDLTLQDLENMSWTITYP